MLGKEVQPLAVQGLAVQVELDPSREPFSNSPGRDPPLDGSPAEPGVSRGAVADGGMSENQAARAPAPHPLHPAYMLPSIILLGFYTRFRNKQKNPTVKKIIVYRWFRL